MFKALWTIEQIDDSVDGFISLDKRLKYAINAFREHDFILFGFFPLKKRIIGTSMYDTRQTSLLAFDRILDKNVIRVHVRGVTIKQWGFVSSSRVGNLSVKNSCFSKE